MLFLKVPFSIVRMTFGWIHFRKSLVTKNVERLVEQKGAILHAYGFRGDACNK